VAKYVLLASYNFDHDAAETQGSNIPASCPTPSETIVVMIALPMTKTAFNLKAIEKKYIHLESLHLRQVGR
jgi:hypothetical protein